MKRREAALAGHSTGTLSAAALCFGVVLALVTGCSSSPPPPAVATVTVSLASASIYLGQTAQATAALADASANVLTGRTVVWTSARPAVATVSATGLVTAVGPGTAAITATSEGITGSATLTALAPVATVTVTLASTSIYPGQTSQATAVVKDASANVLTGRAVVWTSASPAVATVNAIGLVTAVGPGTAAITATSESVAGSATLTALAPVATVTVALASASLYVGQTSQATAALKDASGNALTGRAIAWTSANAAVATVDATGLVTAVGAGNTAITATSESKAGAANADIDLAVPGVPKTGTDGQLIKGPYSDCFWNYGAVGADPDYNLAYPDAGATYWGAYYRRPANSTLDLTGSFPRSRYASVISYDKLGQPVDGIADYQLAPDTGSVNPFIAGNPRRVANAQKKFTLRVTTAFNPGFTVNNPRNLEPVRNELFSKPKGAAAGGTGIPLGTEVGSDGQTYALELMLYRVYIPDRDYDLTGGAGLPQPRLTLANGTVLTGQQACDAMDSESKDFKIITASTASRLPDPSALLLDDTTYSALRHPELLTVGQQVKVYPPAGQPGTALYQVGRPVTDPVTFPATYTPNVDTSTARSTAWYAQYDRRYLLQLWTGDDAPGASTTPTRVGGGFFPNIHNNYIRTVLHRGFGKVAVLKGKVPTTPATHDHGATMGSGQARYTSLCMNESVRTTRVMNCAFDETIVADSNQAFTVVVSRTEDRPTNAIAACGITWIEWSPSGDGASDHDFGWFQIRHMLADTTFHTSVQDTQHPGDELATMGAYLPNVTYTSTADFQTKGCSGATN